MIEFHLMKMKIFQILFLIYMIILIMKIMSVLMKRYIILESMNVNVL